MTPHNFVDVLKAKVAEAIAEETARLAMGAAADWADYQHRTGLIKGLEQLNRIITDLTEDKK